MTRYEGDDIPSCLNPCSVSFSDPSHSLSFFTLSYVPCVNAHGSVGCVSSSSCEMVLELVGQGSQRVWLERVAGTTRRSLQHENCASLSNSAPIEPVIGKLFPSSTAMIIRIPPTELHSSISPSLPAARRTKGVD